MSQFVTDAHALIWFLFAPERLSAKALQAFESVGDTTTLIIPAVVVAEMVMVVEKGRIGATMESLQVILHALQKSADVKFATLTADDILQSADLVGIPDIFDRLIAYEAVKHEAQLITRDRFLAESRYVETIW